MEKGLIIASFGTTHADARVKAISNIEVGIQQELQGQHSLYSLRAFTSRMVKKRLWDKDGFYVFDEKEAYRHLKDRAISQDNIYVQPLHILPGMEYEKLEKMEGIKLGEPLFAKKEDLDSFVDRLKFNVGEDEALILFGHGSDHKNDQIYFDLQDTYIKKGYENIFIVCVEGALGLDQSIEKILALKPKKVILQPLMIVAGDHAKNDMAAQEEGSLRYDLEQKGLEVEVRLIGLGELDEMVEIFIEKTRKLLEDKVDTKADKTEYLQR